jgi:two-component system OmpR family response regulator
MSFKRLAVVVEDDPSLQRTIVEHLGASFDVRAAANYESAVRLLASCVPIVVCVDLGLPNESGYELCEYMRRDKAFLSVPILVMSERSSPEDMAHAEEAGANAFLKKPFAMRQLSKYVEALLDGRHSSRPSVRRLRMP